MSAEGVPSEDVERSGGNQRRFVEAIDDLL